MTYFAIICSSKEFKAILEVSEVLITYVTNRRKARVMLHVGTGHSNKHRIKIQHLVVYLSERSKTDN